jgi:ABC-type nitrate/sulfonate/bicarbonate transport system permease component
VMFIFLACVAFILSDTAEAIRRIETSYIDTALTLGARPWQVILKVLLPLALPSICNSLRLMFGLAFGYIMLAETIKFGNEAGGLGHLINTSIRRGLRENVFLVLLLIPLVALAIDQLLFWLQRQLFPHVYGGRGWLHRGMRALIHALEDGWRMLVPHRTPG